MTKTPMTSAAQAAAPIDPAMIDTAAEYDVLLTRPVTIGAAYLLPLHDHTMTGAFLALLIKEYGADAVHSAAVRG
ncbi:hypothetical protein SAMN06265338_1157 [Rhodoblastus acidophilus]|uniref:Uncharacterized protein n=1 Tax=Rhodoblastus acidophilus TaxID=1074 RepID=A0A212S7I7_RHOAC|nr:hypothetical protein [Rhodoblastus acidophilus]SNB81283.1 hypothetical protein SAMN06265338_1157 [Rhodoblastus acidophilus]